MRKNYIDYIKALGMILVVLGHINFANGVIKEWVYSYHMPLFFVASGLLLSKRDVNKEYLIKKTKALIVPYFLWGMIYASLNVKNIVGLIYGSYYTISRAESLTSLWFLPAMFISVVVCQLLIDRTGKRIYILGASVLSIFLAFIIPQLKFGFPWCVDVSFSGIGFLLLGYLAKDYIASLINDLKKPR